MKALYQKIRALNGKNYGLYKSLSERSWKFGDFEMEFLHVQGDPYAPASRVMIKSALSSLGYGSEWGSSFERRLALSDFLYRKLGRLTLERFPEKDAPIVFDVSGPEMLVRNSLWIDNGDLRACMQVRLPGDGRRIQAESAAEILTMVLPDLVSAALYCDKEDEESLNSHYQVLADRAEILKELEVHELAAFVPDGAVLPRASGISEEPMEGAIPFESPAEMSVVLDVNGRKIRGMGIPKGITVITGGAFHGKSTLLQALTHSVYPHIPGDGREGIVIDETAVRIGVEDGRSIRGTDISLFVRNLPGGISTANFSTASASGSTSQAANLLEALEAGASTLLIDEDASAVNFLIRDVRVRKLLGDEREPLIPLTDRIHEICHGNRDACRSFILVAGACGDYLDIADNIIIMANYRAECARFNASAASGNSQKQLDGKIPAPVDIKQRSFSGYVQPLLSSVRPLSAVERQVKVKLNGDYFVQIGFLLSDTSRLSSLVGKQQRFGAGFMLLNLLQNAASNGNETGEAQKSQESRSESIGSAVGRLCEKIQNVGFRNLPQGMSREMSLPRPIDIACVLFRLRELKK